VNAMRDRIRRLSWKVELAIVLTLAFGWTLRSSLYALLTPTAIAHRPTPPISNIGVWSVVLLELIILGLLVPFLRTRGWRLARLGIQPSLKGCLQGFGLALTVYALYFVFAELVMSVWPAVASALSQTRLVGNGLSWTTITVASIINPFYEEVFVCGYLISVLTERRPGAAVAPVRIAAAGEVESTGADVVRAPTSAPVQAVSLATAVNISAAIRLSYHLYQGVAGVLALVPTGLVFAIWFVRTRQLWPLIVAHAVIDFVGLAAGAG
jgi:membrane protease YdiL (CAAX protease family)